MKENEYQAKLIKKLLRMFPGCIILKNDPNYIQGFPDLTILYFDHWAVLEVKRSKDASHQPNQDYYIAKCNEMSFGKFIFPENEEEVLNELQQAFKNINRDSRISWSQQLPLAELHRGQTADSVEELLRGPEGNQVA